MAENDVPGPVTHPPLGWWTFVTAVALTGAATLSGLFLAPILSLANIAFLFLLPVIISSGRDGLWGGLTSAALATLAFNFFFVPPTYTLHIAEPNNIVTLAVFGAIALAVSSVAERLKAQTRTARRLQQESALLSSLSQDFSSMSDPQKITGHLTDMLGRWTDTVVTVLTESGMEATSAILGPMDQAAALWALAHGQPAGKGSAVIAGADAYYVPLRVGMDTKVVRFWRSDAILPVPEYQRSFIRAAVERGGDALHRADVLAQKSELDARQQHDVMREALLASISHDLRTPLTSIRVGLDALESEDADLLSATRLEAERLDRMLCNLLDLARLRAHADHPERLPIDLTDVIDAAVAGRENMLRGRPVSVAIDPDLPLILADARMLHHMLLNLIDNACKYSAAGTAVALCAKREGDSVILQVEDHGTGLPDMDMSDLFGLFQRGMDADRVPGNGLGLAVVDGFARSMGLTVTAANRGPDKSQPEGACFTLRFPADSLYHPAEGNP